MQKIINYFKKNYLAVTVILAILLTVLGSVIIINLIKRYQNRIEYSNTTGSFYQYFDTTKSDFEAKLSYENDQIVNIEGKEYNIYENSLIYLQDNTSVIIPKVSSIVFYLQDNATYQLPKYSEVILDSGTDIVKSLGIKGIAANFFIYDGEDTYFFPLNVVLNINNRKIELSPYSYVIATSENIIYYDYESDKLEKYEGNINKATISFNEITIDIEKNAIVKNGRVAMLNKNIKVLKKYMEEE